MLLIRIFSKEILGDIHLLYNTTLFEKILSLIILFVAFFVFNKLNKNDFKSVKVFNIKTVNFIFWIVFIIGLSIRLYKLDLSLIHDEAFQLQAIQGILKTGFPKYPSGLLYPRGLIYSYCSAFICFLTGKVTVWACRLTSIFFWIATTLLLWKICKKIFNYQTALLVHIVFNFSLFSTAFSRFSRMYMAVAFFALLAFSSFYFAFLKNEKKWTFFFWMAILLSPLTHKIGFLNWVLIPVVFFINKKKSNNFKNLLLVILLILLLTFSTSSGYGSLKGFLLNSYKKLSLSLNFYFPAFYPLIFPWMSLISAIGFIFNLKTVKKKFWSNKSNYFFIPLISFIFLISFTDFKMNQRYLFFLFPFLIITFASSLEQLISFFSETLHISYKLLFTVIFLLIFIYQIKDIKWILNINYGSVIPRYKGVSSHVYVYPDYKTTTNFVKNQYQQDDIIITVADNTMQHSFYFDKINYKLSNQLKVQPKKVVKNNIIGINIKEVKNKIGKKRVWIITSYDSDIDSLKYLHFDMLWPEARNFLNENKNKVVYHGKDNISKVYLFIPE